MLSSILFIISTYDLPKSLSITPNMRVRAFADDVKVYTSYDSSDANLIKNELSMVVLRVISWCQEWGLKLSLENIQVCPLGSRTNVAVGSVSACRQHEVRDLGILVTENLSLESHINAIVAKLFVPSFVHSDVSRRLT